MWQTAGTSPGRQGPHAADAQQDFLGQSFAAVADIERST